MFFMGFDDVFMRIYDVFMGLTMFFGCPVMLL